MSGSECLSSIKHPDEWVVMPKLYQTPFLTLAKGRWHRMPILSSDICAFSLHGGCVVCATGQRENKKEICMWATVKFGGKRRVVGCVT